MKCFNHPEKDAIALCKNCYKGLCLECATEVTNGIACKDTCEEEVIFLDKTIQKMKTNKIYNTATKSYYVTSLIYFLIGISFNAFGFYTDIPPLKPYFFIMGSIFILGSILTTAFGKKMKKDIN